MTVRSKSPSSRDQHKEGEPAGASFDAGSDVRLLNIDSVIFQDVKVALKVRLGEVSLTVEDLLGLKPGAVLTLDRLMSEPVDLHLNDALVARGQIVAVGDHYGIRITEIGAPR